MKFISRILILFCSNISFGQLVVPDITARVDTTNVEIKQVYKLYTDYLNSKPDSIYENPYWNKREINQWLKIKKNYIDKSASFMFFYSKKGSYFNHYKPKVLQIDKVGENRYLIKTIFRSLSKNEEDLVRYDPDVIIKLYAVKDEKGDFKLENVIDYDTRYWNTYKYRYITYIVHPSIKFNKKEAREAIIFCEKVCKKFDLEFIPFKYYVTGNPDDMEKLFNFEFILSYHKGLTSMLEREIFTSYSSESFPHEFIHLLFYNSKNDIPRPFILNEGLATWLAGPSRNESFEGALKKFSNQIRNNSTITFNDILTNKYRNPYDNNPIYLSGGVIYKMIYEKCGVTGVFELYNCRDDEEVLKKLLEKLFNMSYKDVDSKIIDYIKKYGLE
jgi:hypothetical protein